MVVLGGGGRRTGGRLLGPSSWSSLSVSEISQAYHSRGKVGGGEGTPLLGVLGVLGRSAPEELPEEGGTGERSLEAEDAPSLRSEVEAGAEELLRSSSEDGAGVLSRGEEGTATDASRAFRMSRTFWERGVGAP